MSERKLKNSGTTTEVSLNKSKNYKYDKSGALVEATTIGDNDIVFSGSKSSLRRLNDLERNVSILASTLTTTDGATTDSDDDSFDGIFPDPVRFRNIARFDAALSINAAVAMNSNKITGLGTPTASGDASTKGYVDSAVAAVVNSAPGTLDTLNELAAALGSDANFSTTVTTSIATKLTKSSNLSDLTNAATARTNLGLATVASSGSYADLSSKPTIPTNNNQITNGAGYYSSGSTPSFGATSTGALSVTGAITATGEITAYYSDVNLKKDIVAITDPIAKVMALRGVTYRPNDAALALGITDKEEVGVIAQEVEAVLPQLVCPSAFEGYKTVKYEKLTALLLEAVKAQQTQIEALTAQVAKLSGQ
jgi:hypothetical protein